MIIKINRLFKGKWADIRSYQAIKSIKENQPIICKLPNGQQMTLQPYQLLDYTQFTDKVFKSKSGGSDYKIYSYKFTQDAPDLSNDEELSKNRLL